MKATSRFKTPFNHESYVGPHQFEVCKTPSETVPGQSMTVREMMRRHAAGLPVLGAKIPLYQTDEEKALGLPDLSRMDRAEKEMVLHEFREKLTAMQQEIDRKKALVRQQQLDEQIEKLVEERIKAKAEAAQRPPGQEEPES